MELCALQTQPAPRCPAIPPAHLSSRAEQLLPGLELPLLPLAANRVTSYSTQSLHSIFTLTLSHTF